MLTIHDLIEIDYIPLETELSLGLLVEFYEQYLSKRIFVFELENGEIVKLFFRNATELYHVSGIAHIYKDYEIRIRSIACIDTIIKNCEYLFFSSGKVLDTEIKIKYLLLKGLDGRNLHLGIDTYNKNRPYFARTLLITDGNQQRKFIDKTNERLRVVKLQIREKETDRILINVERKKAMDVAAHEVEKIANQWLQYDFPIILRNFLEKEDGNSELCKGNCSVTKNQRKMWKRQLMKIIEDKKEDLKILIREFDPYWAAKIVGETIRNYDQNFALKSIDEKINKIESHIA